ncbi:restriction endonuclease subunit S [Acinetobacter sp. YH12255]|uniref:restriction endonuclease subunit S n=1 Tax=Acinetobacter sp. YH12255 TaxID=2601179 RepID=UPI0015D2CC1F|nr:restriction endonuclease subunit S [Acinetobacter sp. YH12255]
MSTGLNMEYQEVKFDDICREVKLTTKDPIADGYDKYIGLEHLDSGSLKIKRWGLIAEDNPSFTRVFKKGHILFGKRRCYLKKAAIAEFDGICSGDILVFEAKKTLNEPKLLPFIIHSQKFWQWAIDNSSGSLSPRTKFSALKDFSVKLPTGSTLKELSLLLENLERLETKSEVALHSTKQYLQRMVDYYTINDRLDFIDRDCKKSLRLKEIVTVNSNQLSQSTDPNFKFNYIEISDVSFPGKVTIKEKIQFSEASSRARRILKKNNIVISTVRPNHRATFYVDAHLENSICSTGFCVLSAKEEYLAKYIFYFTLSKQFSYSLSNLATGTSFPAVNESDVLSQKIVLYPESKTKKIIKILDKQYEIMRMNESNLKKILDIKKSIIERFL